MSSRGRGRGRGRGRRNGRGTMRGRFGSRGRSRHVTRESSTSGPKDVDLVDSVPSMDNVQAYFTQKTSFEQHFEGQQKNRNKYAAAIAVMMKNGVNVSQNARVRALAASWARQDHELANALLSVRSQYTFVEVLKTLTILDAGRAARKVEKQIKRLQCQKTKVTPKTLSKLKTELGNLLSLKPSCGTATGAVIKHVKKWVQSFNGEELEFFALHFPVHQWKKLADICHFHPEKDFPELPWFLRFCFGDPAPEGSIVNSCKVVNEENVNELVQSFPVPYAHVKQFHKALAEESKKAIAEKEKKIDTLLWYYEQLTCPAFDKVILERLEKDEKVTLRNGKLMERLLTCKMLREGFVSNPDEIYFTWDWDAHPDGPDQQNTVKQIDENKAPFLNHLIQVANDNISQISLPLESPIVVFGDASGSMEIAIKTSVIIAGILTKITSAKLVFFDEISRDAPYIPQNIEQVLELALSTVADSGTAPASGLFPFYENKEVVKTFIVVTDEGENDQYEGYWFADLFDKYYKEVYPAKLVFVSFLPNQRSEGEMVTSLKDKGYSPLQFKFNENEPDLTKLDYLLGLLSLETASFSDQITTTELVAKLKGVEAVFSDLNQLTSQTP